MKTADIALVDELRQTMHLPGETTFTERAFIEKTVFVIDRSASMYDNDYPPNRLKAGVKAVTKYIDVKLRTAPRDLAGAVIFNSCAEIICSECEITNAKHAFIKALQKVTPDNGTRITAGLQKAGMVLADHNSGIRNRIVLLTDGYGGRPEKTAEMLKNQGVIIDVIGIGGSPLEVNEPCLKRVASVVNGELRYRFIGDKKVLCEHFRQIANTIVQVG